MQTFIEEKNNGISLIEKLVDPNVKNINPHEVARELIKLYNSRDSDSVKKLRDAYLIGLIASKRGSCSIEDFTKARALVDANLLDVAGLADIVASCGYEASGQLHLSLKHDGPVACFFQEATGYKSA